MLIKELIAEKKNAQTYQAVTDLIQRESGSAGAMLIPGRAAEEGEDSESDDPAPRREVQVISVPAAPSARDTYAAVAEQNPDFVGWLHIPDTSIDYPVLQSPDRPNYYLRRDFFGEFNSYGSLYMKEDCRWGESDNCIIYGHNMRNGTMFCDLVKYLDQDFYENHKTFSFDTLEEFGEYEIVAVFQTVAYEESGFRFYDFVDAEDAEDFDDYLARCRSLGLYTIDVEAAYGDQLLTLSTCEYSQRNGRVVVVARQI